MKLTVQQLENMIQEIQNLVDRELYNIAYEEYEKVDADISRGNYVVSEVNVHERSVVVEFYSSFAYFLFSFSEYKRFFEIYIKAQNYGSSLEERKKFIYEAFILPNIDEFRSNYETNTERMKKSGCLKKTIEFDELHYWLITTGESNEYYLYEKETNLIKEKITINISELKDLTNESLMNAGDSLLVDNGDWSQTQSYINSIISKSSNCYLITSSLSKLLSYLQGGIFNEDYLSRLTIFESADEFKTYFKNNNNFLPRQYFGPEESKAEYDELVSEIHNYRIIPENRFGDNILLSICIPSFNRGRRAYDNVIHSLLSDLDEEIEVVVSNNGTQNETKEYYEKISEIKDARITYFEFDENQGVALNFCKVAELASGKYVLLLSDEDLIVRNELKAIVAMIDKIKDNNVAIIRAGTDGQAVMPYVGMTKPGKDAIYHFMLSSNYVSGNIYSKELLEEHNLIDYVKQNLDNEACFYYPHSIWELILCQYGSALGWNRVLINEGQEEKTSIGFEENKDNINQKITYYATIQSRLNQHRGFFEVIREMEVSKIDFDIFRGMYKKLCAKTMSLVYLSIQVSYQGIDTDTSDFLEKAYNESVKCLDEIYHGKKSSNKHKYVEDMKEIKKCYLYFKN